MLGRYKVLAIVPARGGSKGVPRKNIRAVAGRPLISWAFDEANKSKYIDRTILSSEDEEIIQLAQSHGYDVPFVRPRELAADDTPGIDVVTHAISQLPEYDLIVLLQPTSPLRLASDIDAVIEACMIQDRLGSAISVSPLTKPPTWIHTVDAKGQLAPYLPTIASVANRQEMGDLYQLNGAAYAASRHQLREKGTFLVEGTKGVVMPTQRSLDIDSELDFGFFEYMASRPYSREQSF